MLTNFLASSAQVAKALDWRRNAGSVLSLSVCKDKIDLALAAHPSVDFPVHQLPSIPLKYEVVNNKKVLRPEVSQELAKLTRAHHVCGFVVNWPVQKEGWCGHQCGKVLHTLDNILSQSNVLSPSRPVCLWDSTHSEPEQEDDWGRASYYTITSTKSVHKASEEQYYTNTTQCVASEVWNDFMRSHWPELVERRKLLSHANPKWNRKTLLKEENRGWDEMSLQRSTSKYCSAAL